MSDALPVTDASAEALLGEVVDEFLERLGRGERPDVEEYARRYPQLAAAVHQLLPALQAVHLSAADGPPGAEGPEIEPEGPLGDFRIVREVGRGGMGVVYEAVQISLGRRVALKVLPFAAALDGRQLRRFQNEAQAAAHLHHQHIVPVYAVGCERGVHYYAMQFVEGQTLAALIHELRLRAGLQPGGQGDPVAPASAAGLGTPAADTCRQAAVSTALSTRRPAFLRTAAHLGLQAAEALEHAHGLGVVHRDVKPANLLVDVQGNLWVTDFGLAQVQTDTRLTLTGDLVGTLRYMSPEQALARGTGVDHRTDLYSLGATLYELLTLEPAFGGRDRQELLRQIAFEEPRPPRRVNKAVPAELETIVFKAMAKDPAERYATAQELADDLRRFLEDKPIRARRPSWLERGRKWARRHRPVVWSATVAALVALAVVTGSVGWVLRDRAARQAQTVSDLQAALEEARRSHREGLWPQAQAAARRAEALLREGAAEPALAEQVHGLLRDLAEEEADRRLVTRLEELRLLQADVNVKQDQFVLERARPDYRQAFQDYGLRPDALAPEEAAARLRRRPEPVRGILLAALDHWLILARYRKAPEAGWLERVLTASDADAWRQRLRAARKSNDRSALEKLAREVDAAAQPPESLFLLDMALRQRGAREGAVALLRRAQEAFPGDFWINHDLGRALEHSQPPQYAEAIRFLTAAVAIRPQSAGARLNLGSAFLHEGRLDEAIEAFRKAIALKPGYAMAHNNLGSALSRKGQLDEAVAAWRRAIELRPDLALAHNGLGRALWEMGRLEEAGVTWLRVAALTPRDAEAYWFLGAVRWKQGRLDEAAAAFRKAAELKPDEARHHGNLGSVLLVKGCLEEAVSVYRRAIELKPDWAEAHAKLGVALARKGQLDEAVAAYRQAIRLQPDCPTVHYDLGVALARKGNLDEAAAACRRAIALKPDFAEAYCDLGCAHWMQDRPDEAGRAFRRAIELKPDYADAHYNLGNVHLLSGRLDEAVAAYRRALQLKPDAAMAHCNLGHALRQQGAFAKALAALQRGHELGSRKSDWPYPSAQWVRQCQRLVELDGRLPAVLTGEAQPQGAAERNEYAELCYYKKLYAASTRLRTGTLTADLKLAGDLGPGSRYDGACAAALAAAGQGADAGTADEAERARWRKQALTWLRANLTAHGKRLDGGKAEDRRLVRRRLRHWQRDKELASLRDPALVGRLPADERQACRQLWAEVEALLDKAGAGE
jgi:tetratricopeptide (TPR) repeat protein